MFHRHLRDRISSSEAFIADLLIQVKTLWRELEKQSQQIDRIDSSIDSTQHYVMSIEERQLFDETGKVKLPHNGGTITLPAGDVIRGILNYIGLEYTPSEPVTGVTFKHKEN